MPTTVSSLISIQYTSGASTEETITNVGRGMTLALAIVSGSSCNITVKKNNSGGDTVGALVSPQGKAQGTITVANNGNVANNDTITLKDLSNADVVFTAKLTGAVGNQFNKGADAPATATNIAAAINANATFNAIVDPGNTSRVIVQQALSPLGSGTAGNGKTIATSKASAFTLANFSGAVDTGLDQPAELTVANLSFSSTDNIFISESGASDLTTLDQILFYFMSENPQTLTTTLSTT
jgi:fructose-specific phosphotransferase system component IIB